MGPDVTARRETLDRGEREVKDQVLRMASLVEQQIRDAISALVARDAEQATLVVAGDAKVNDAQREASALITTMIATQQPVARDLRFLLSLDRVTYELERMGDHAGDVAKQVRKMAAEPALRPYADVATMGRIAADLVRGITGALVDVDDALAREVAAGDDEIDHLYQQVFLEVNDLMRADPANVERGTRILFAAFDFERIGDRVTNIAEDVVYLATGLHEDLNP
ncbi:MAG TPA: phosphate signaling complex protein PhoU [Candidatus Limnocylindria bacterium]|nr:phosphate signaling complex protein PhoU [Candidatus Limnocylindria bacterium]